MENTKKCMIEDHDQIRYHFPSCAKKDGSVDAAKCTKRGKTRDGI